MSPPSWSTQESALFIAFSPPWFAAAGQFLVIRQSGLEVSYPHIVPSWVVEGKEWFESDSQQFAIARNGSSKMK
jgi:hypothetical protein